MAKTKKTEVTVSGKTVSTKNLELNRRGRPSRYLEIQAKIAELTDGKSFLIEVPLGGDAKSFANVIGGALRRNKVTAEAGCVLRVGCTADGKSVAVICQAKAEKPAKAAKPKAKPTKAASKPGPAPFKK